MMEIGIIIAVIGIIMLIVQNIRLQKIVKDSNKDNQKDIELLITKTISNANLEMNNSINGNIKTLENSQKGLNDTVATLLKDGMHTQTENTLKMAAEQKETLYQLRDSVNEMLSDGLQKQNETMLRMSKHQQESQELLAGTIKESLKEIRETNEQKLNAINEEISNKLDKSLNERLDSTFGQIGERLNSLYESLGELNKLTTGVTDLNKTLSNVKTRGIWGEIQLQGILEDIMTPSQYDENVITKKGTADRVEFAIKIPSKSDDKETIYLPIDSKFPADIYGKIVDASEKYDSAALETAMKELEQRIKLEARTIRDKYIDPPNTTDFAIMFIPTESLYSEILRIDGLYEWCQSNCKIIISGPTTIAALLNSLRVGFSNLTLNKKTQEVIKTLQAVKTQYSQLDELIDKTQKKLSEATSSTEKLKDRTRIIQKKMSKIEMLDENEANELLGITTKEIEE